MEYGAIQTDTGTLNRQPLKENELFLDVTSFQ